MNEKEHMLGRILPFLLAIITTIVVVFIAQISLDLKGELGELRGEIAAMKTAQTAAVSVQPFAALENNCTRCHSERRFMGIHGNEADITQVLRHMEEMPDMHLSPADLDKVHNSMTLLKCTKCHDEGIFTQLSAMPAANQRATLDRMRGKPGSELTREEVQSIPNALLKIQGF